MAAYSQSITGRLHNIHGLVHCEPNCLLNSLWVYVLMCFDSRHDVIAACKPRSKFFDSFGFAHQERFRLVFDKTTTKCTAQSRAAGEDCYRR